MKNLTNQIKQFMQDEEGVTAIEYGMIAALIAVAIGATVKALGTDLDNTFLKVQNCVRGNASCQ